MSKKMKENRYLVITAYPQLPGKLKTIFSTAEGSLKKSIENPPYLRYAGWNLPNDKRGEIIRGEFIRVGNTSFEFLDVYRDGTTIFAVRADEISLAWHTPREEQRLNPVALVETIYNFTNFFQLVLKDFEQQPDHVLIRVDMRNLHLEGIKTSLPPHYSALWRFGHPDGVRSAPGDNMTKIIEFNAEKFAPDIAAFEVLKEIYLWFGHDEDKIPFVIEREDGKRIAPDQIMNLKG